MDDAHPSLDGINQWLARRSAEQRIAWALQFLPGAHILSSSFGAQSAVALHMATVIKPELPVVLVDTGYLFPETYAFVDALTERLSLRVKRFGPQSEQAWSPERVAQLEQLGEAGIAAYNEVHKVEPMQRALRELAVGTWIAGLRRSQSTSRRELPILSLRSGRWKLHPLADWSDRDVGQYLRRHDLPYHPLWERGFVSIGDSHSTRALQAGMREEDTRFFGLKRECGLHDADTNDARASFALPAWLSQGGASTLPA